MAYDNAIITMLYVQINIDLNFVIFLEDGKVTLILNIS